MLELWKITESILAFERIKRRTFFIHFGIVQLLHLLGSKCHSYTFKVAYNIILQTRTYINHVFGA